MRLSIGIALFLVSGLFAPRAHAWLSPIEIVTENGHNPSCEEFRFNRDLRVYKDPSLFLGALSLFERDPRMGWENLMRENPLMTTLRGSAQIILLGPAREFKNFGLVAKLYETVEPRLKLQEIPSTEVIPSASGRGKNVVQKIKKTGALILPVMICGDSDAYRNSLGFVLESDFKSAQLDVNGTASLPPSVRSIPEWRTSDSRGVLPPSNEKRN